jgi:hypothetical protein
MQKYFTKKENYSKTHRYFSFGKVGRVLGSWVVSPHFLRDLQNKNKTKKIK